MLPMAAKSQFVNKWVEFDDKEQSSGTIINLSVITVQLNFLWAINFADFLNFDFAEN